MTLRRLRENRSTKTRQEKELLGEIHAADSDGTPDDSAGVRLRELQQIGADLDERKSPLLGLGDWLDWAIVSQYRQLGLHAILPEVEDEQERARRMMGEYEQRRTDLHTMYDGMRADDLPVVLDAEHAELPHWWGNLEGLTTWVPEDSDVPQL